MRYTLSALIDSTISSRTRVRAISPHVHNDSERRRSSGSSQASLVANVATSGGKARRTTAAQIIHKPSNASTFKALRPLPDAVSRDAQLVRDAPNVEVRRERQNDARAEGVTRGHRLRAGIPLQLGTLRGGKRDLDGADERHTRPTA